MAWLMAWLLLSILVQFFLYSRRDTGDQSIGRHVLGYHGAGSSDGAAANSHWRDQHCVRTDFHVVFNYSFIFFLAVIVASHGSRADVCILADRCIAQIGQMH